MEPEYFEKSESNLRESFINTSIVGGTFEIGIIGKKGKIENSSIIFDKNKRIIQFKSIAGKELLINYSDIIGFFKEEKLLNEKPQEENNQIFNNNRVYNLNCYQKKFYKSCSILGTLFCRPKKTYSKRKLKNLKLVINNNSIKYIYLEFENIFIYGILNKDKLYCLKKDSNKTEKQDKESDIVLTTDMNIIENISPSSMDTQPELEEVNLRASISNDIFLKPRRKMLVFLNPVGGNGNAKKIWNSVSTMFEQANVEIELFLTQYHKHAYDHSKEIEIGKYNGIICCSGDGIIHEVINGIFSRTDSEDFLNYTAIGVIPGGSANGYSKTITEESQENFDMETCAYIICKGDTKMFDIMEIESATQSSKIYSFLSISWGFMSDVDLESEKLRCCGHARFTLFGAYLLFCQRNNYASFFYLTEDKIDKDFKYPSLNEELDMKYYNKESKRYSYFNALLNPWVTSSVRTAPKALPNDGNVDVISMDRGTNGKYNFFKLLVNQDSGDYYDNKGEIRKGSGVDYKKIKSFRLIPKTRLDESDDVGVDRNLPRFYSIDGERYKIEPIQVNVKSKSLRVFCMNK